MRNKGKDVFTCLLGILVCWIIIGIVLLTLTSHHSQVRKDAEEQRYEYVQEARMSMHRR